MLVLAPSTVLTPMLPLWTHGPLPNVALTVGKTEVCPIKGLKLEGHGALIIGTSRSDALFTLRALVEGSKDWNRGLLPGKTALSPSAIPQLLTEREQLCSRRGSFSVWNQVGVCRCPSWELGFPHDLTAPAL